jgi:hypothetical protein
MHSRTTIESPPLELSRPAVQTRGSRACPCTPGRGERAEPDAQLPAGGLDVTGACEGLADHGVGLVLGAGVVPVQCPGQGGLRVEGSHPDRVGDQLDLGVQDHGVGGQVAKPDPGRGGGGRGAGGVQGGERGLRGCVEGVELRVGDDHRLARGGAAELHQRLVAGSLSGRCGMLGVPDPGRGGLLRRVRHLPGGVIGGDGVAVAGVESETGAGVTEVVLLPGGSRR